MDIEAQVNFKGIEQLIIAMNKGIELKVGLLAGKGGNEEVSEDLDLAGLGAIHEFGCDIKITKKMAAFLGIKAKELGLPAKKGGKSDGYLHIPARSWLQMPLERKNDILKKVIEKFGEGKEDVIDYIAKTGDLRSLAIMLGTVAVEQIKEGAFATGGWGEWAQNSPFTIASKGSANPLIDKGRLRNAVDYEVI